MSEAHRAEEAIDRLLTNPRYHDLVARRGRFGMILSGVILIVYFGFILTIAFAKWVLAAPIAGGATSTGIPVGIAIILLSIGLTGVYVWRANTEFDRLSAALIAEVPE